MPSGPTVIEVQPQPTVFVWLNDAVYYQLPDVALMYGIVRCKDNWRRASVDRPVMIAGQTEGGGSGYSMTQPGEAIDFVFLGTHWAIF